METVLKYLKKKTVGIVFPNLTLHGCGKTLIKQLASSFLASRRVFVLPVFTCVAVSKPPHVAGSHCLTMVTGARC